MFHEFTLHNKDRIRIKTCQENKEKKQRKNALQFSWTVNLNLEHCQRLLNVLIIYERKTEVG